jgi:glutathione S-transferase
VSFVGLFSRIPPTRDPPHANKTLHLRLITVSVSHYCEKARWALDLLEADPSSPVYYTEDGHPPAFVSFHSVPASKDQAWATPMVVFPDGHFINKSDTILKELCPALYPDNFYISNAVDEFEQYMGQRLGVAIRLYAYHCFLDPPHEYYEALTHMVCLYSSKIEKTLFKAMLDRGIDKGIRRILKITDESAKVCKETIRQVFREVSDRLETSGGDYLMDTRATKYGFTAADLTFCALVYLYIQPPAMSNLSIEDNALPAELLEFCNELRETRAGQYVLRVYDMHRPVSVATGRINMKTLNMDRKP